jgi:acetylornithine deacetylase
MDSAVNRRKREMSERPMSVPRGDAVTLTRALVSVDSRNPGLEAGAPGEGEVARRLANVLEAWGFDVELMDCAPGRPNVVARVGPGAAGTRTLMFNGHLDVVGTEGMVHAPFDAEMRGGRVYGRGATDMKGGIAAMCAAAASAADNGLRGTIVIAAVVDEELRSIGTSALVSSGVTADAAIITEPTKLAIMPSHKGFTWAEIALTGRAAHGSSYDLGIDAIRHAGHLLVELDQFERSELMARSHPLLGRASLHAATVSGGVGWSTYPERCTLEIERRTLPGETREDVVRELREACERVGARVEHFDARVRHVFSQSPSDVAVDAPIARALGRALREKGESVRFAGMSAWTDAAILNDAGIPAICFGPGDIAQAHAAEEWIAVDEIERATAVLARLAVDWCNGD